MFCASRGNSDGIKLDTKSISLRQDGFLAPNDCTSKKTMAVIDFIWPTVLRVQQDNDASSPYGKILHSLHFPAMKLQELKTPEATKETFEWAILGPQHRNGPRIDGQATWSDLPAWLRVESDNLYWITGKPGSGKSTLIKYLTRSKRQELEALLTGWAGNHSLYVASFHAGHAGSSLEQRSMKGLLKTLLHQLLQAAPELTPRVCPRHWAMLKLFGTGGDVPLEDWTTTQLQDALMVFITLSGRRQNRTMIFIDGLDEFDVAERPVLVTLVHDLCSGFPAEVKICVTSRPWDLFSKAFGSQPSLRMENLTDADMRIHVQKGFQNSLGLMELKQRYGLGAIEELTDCLVGKAQGVFLWAAVVTSNLSGAMIAGATIDELRAILRSLPENLASLYRQIWDRLDAVDKCETAKCIELVERSEEPLGVSTMFASQQPDPFESAKLLPELQRQHLNRLLLSRARGLLEITGSDVVSYHHRSLTEWIWEHHSEIRNELPRDFDPHLQLAVGKAAVLLAAPRDSRYSEDSGFMSNLELCLRYASKVPDREPLATQLTEALDMFPANGLDYFPQFSYGSVSILGLAAQFVVTPYVRKKVQDKPDLAHPWALDFGDGSLLENALCIPGRTIDVFGPKESSTCCFATLNDRISLIKFLLEQGADPRESSFLLYRLAPQAPNVKRRHHMFDKRGDFPSLKEEMQHMLAHSPIPRYEFYFVNAVLDLFDKHERELYLKDHPRGSRISQILKLGFH